MVFSASRRGILKARDSLLFFHAGDCQDGMVWRREFFSKGTVHSAPDFSRVSPTPGGSRSTRMSLQKQRTRGARASAMPILRDSPGVVGPLMRRNRTSGNSFASVSTSAEGSCPSTQSTSPALRARRSRNRSLRKRRSPRLRTRRVRLKGYFLIRSPPGSADDRVRDPGGGAGVFTALPRRGSELAERPVVPPVRSCTCSTHRSPRRSAGIFPTGAAGRRRLRGPRWRQGHP